MEKANTVSIPRLILFVFLLLLALLGAALAYLHFADLNQYSGRIASAVREATGRDFSIGALDVDLWPRVTLSAEEIALANAPWGSEPDMVRIGRVSTSINPKALLAGRILLQDLNLENVSVVVESDAEGNNNWELAERTETQVDEAGPAGDGVPVAMRAARIVNVKLTRRAPGVDDKEIRLDELTLRPDDADRRQLSAAGAVLGLPLTLDGQLADRRALGWAEPGDFAVSGALGGLQFEAKRRPPAPDSSQETHVEVAIHTDDLAAFLDSAGVDVPLSGAAMINADLSSGESGRRAVLDARLDEFSAQVEFRPHAKAIAANGNLMRLDALGTMLKVDGLPAEPVAFEGTFAREGRAVKIEALNVSTGQALISVSGTVSANQGPSLLELQAEGESLSDVLTTLPALPFDAVARMALASGELAVDPLELRLGSSDVAGSVHLLGGTPTAIRVDLDSQQINLDEIAGEEDQAEEVTESADAAPSADGVSTVQGDEYVFVDKPLPLDALQQNELDFNLAVAQLISSAIPLRKLKVVGALHGGELKADIGFVTPAGAHGASKIRARTSGRELGLNAEVNAQDMHPNIVSGEGAQPEEIPPLSLSMNISSSGASPRALASNSQGSALITLGQGRVDNNLVQRISSDVFAQLFSALNPFAKQEAYSTFACGVMAVTVENGLCTLEPLLLQGEKVTIVAGGELDLKTEKLKLEFNTQPRKGVGVSPDMFVTPFIALGGTLANPALAANPKGTLLTAATGGTYVILKGVLDRAAGQRDQCAEIASEYNHPPLHGN